MSATKQFVYVLVKPIHQLIAMQAVAPDRQSGQPRLTADLRLGSFTTGHGGYAFAQICNDWPMFIKELAPAVAGANVQEDGGVGISCQASANSLNQQRVVRPIEVERFGVEVFVPRQALLLRAPLCFCQIFFQIALERGEEVGLNVGFFLLPFRCRKRHAAGECRDKDHE